MWAAQRVLAGVDSVQCNVPRSCTAHPLTPEWSRRNPLAIRESPARPATTASTTHTSAVLLGAGCFRSGRTARRTARPAMRTWRARVDKCMSKYADEQQPRRRRCSLCLALAPLSRPVSRLHRGVCCAGSERLPACLRAVACRGTRHQAQRLRVPERGADAFAPSRERIGCQLPSMQPARSLQMFSRDRRLSEFLPWRTDPGFQRQSDRAAIHGACKRVLAPVEGCAGGLTIQLGPATSGAASDARVAPWRGWPATLQLSSRIGTQRYDTYARNRIRTQRYDTYCTSRVRTQRYAIVSAHDGTMRTHASTCTSTRPPRRSTCRRESNRLHVRAPYHACVGHEPPQAPPRHSCLASQPSSDGMKLSAAARSCAASAAACGWCRGGEPYRGRSARGGGAPAVGTRRRRASAGRSSFAGRGCGVGHAGQRSRFGTVIVLLSAGLVRRRLGWDRRGPPRGRHGCRGGENKHGEAEDGPGKGWTDDATRSTQSHGQKGRHAFGRWRSKGWPPSRVESRGNPARYGSRAPDRWIVERAGGGEPEREGTGLAVERA
ncbi:hypothetical protein RJ55_04419 [Drechmeria coniospora]|nr:hypothetical protein RJ55_04419 [Drechmeria coniospora]